MNNFQGELTDISVKKDPLKSTGICPTVNTFAVVNWHTTLRTNCLFDTPSKLSTMTHLHECTKTDPWPVCLIHHQSCQPWLIYTNAQNLIHNLFVSCTIKAVNHDCSGSIHHLWHPEKRAFFINNNISWIRISKNSLIDFDNKITGAAYREFWQTGIGELWFGTGAKTGEHEPESARHCSNNNGWCHSLWTF